MPTTKVQGLLLISDRGVAYFIESGIKANRLENLNLDGAGGSTDLVSLKGHLIAQADMEKQAEVWRTEWNKSLPDPFSPLPLTVGPIILQAYNVEIMREDFGDGAISGNGTAIDLT